MIQPMLVILGNSRDDDTYIPEKMLDIVTLGCQLGSVTAITLVYLPGVTGQFSIKGSDDL
jgi:hypothetical protein